MKVLDNLNLTDLQLNSIDDVVNDCKAENERQLKKWGTQTRDIYFWIALITEEFGEMTKEIINDNLEMAYNEGIQATTLMLKLMEMIREEII